MNIQCSGVEFCPLLFHCCHQFQSIGRRKKFEKNGNLNVYQAKLTVFKLKAKQNSVSYAKKKKIQRIDTFLETQTPTHTNEMSENKKHKKHKAQKYTTRATPFKILINLL